MCVCLCLGMAGCVGMFLCICDCGCVGVYMCQRVCLCVYASFNCCYNATVSGVPVRYLFTVYIYS